MELKISDLTYGQKCHLAWRLDHKTGCGLITASRIAKGELGNLTLYEVFRKMGRSMRSAKIHATKVKNFKTNQKANAPE